jgi:hypothetical protein
MDTAVNHRNALLSNLLQDVEPYLQDMTLADRGNPDADFQSVACKMLLDSLFKKWEENTERAESKALLTFLEANHLSGKWEKPDSLKFEGDFAFIWSSFRQQLVDFFETGPVTIELGGVELHAQSIPIVDSESDLAVNGRVGPGASVLAQGTSFYAKLGSSLLSATHEGLYNLYRDQALTDPRWAEMETFRELQYGTCALVSGSQVSFAAKNADIARLICTEPSLNMYLQLGLCAILERRMKEEWNLSLDVQPDINRLLAKVGSRDGSFATIDLSSASDRMSINLCKECLPGWVFDLLLWLRSPRTMAKDYGLDVELGMISTMGNGFTFPLMTVILSCAVRACYLALGIPIRDNPRMRDAGYNVPGNWAVFGDDIIVCREAYDTVVAFIESLGFQVNVSKSFNTGSFRESCGHDYYRGHNVRGVYLKRLHSRQDITGAINRLNDWTFRTGVVLRKGVQYLLSLLRKPLYVPYAEGDDAGIRVPSSIFRPRTRRFKAVYECTRPVPMKVRIGDGVVETPNGCKRLKFNEAAALLSFLLGELRNGTITIRQDEVVTYQKRWRVTPNWDYMPPSVWVNPQTDWRRWCEAVEANIGAV